MFVVHTIYENEGNTTRDYGHVNQFFRCNPEFRAQKDERILKMRRARFHLYQALDARK